MYKHKILVVLYNKKPSISETCISLFQNKNILKNKTDIHIWDNSQQQLTEEEKKEYSSNFKNIGVFFWGDGHNYPLSHVYNEMIRIIDDHGLFIIFDHDSIIPFEYFSELFQKYVNNEDINLFLPVIRYNNKIISPAKLYYFIGHYISNVTYGRYSTKFLTAINSGMAIKCSYLKNMFPGYNKKINFYGTDNDFMYKYSKQNQEVFILKTEIGHTLNYYEENNINSKYIRYQDTKNGTLKQMHEINIAIYILCYIYFLLYNIKLSIKYRSFSFLKRTS